MLHKPVGFGLPRRIHAPVVAVNAIGEAAVCQSVRAYHSSNISIPNNTWTLITTLDSEIWDTNGLHSQVSDTGYLTCQVAGKYIITGAINWGGDSSAGARALALMVNGTIVVAAERRLCNAGGWDVRTTIGTIYDLDVGHYVQLYVWQNTGGALDITANPHRSAELSMVGAT